MKKPHITIWMLSLLMAGTTLFAQSRTPQSGPPTSNQLKPVGINLSVWKSISTQPKDSIGSTAFNLGLFSVQNNLTGLGINLLASVTRHQVTGVQLAGISNNVGQRMKGFQLAGITNINSYGHQGAAIAGLVTINGGEGRGFLASGLANITGNDNRGVTMAGLMNLSGNGGRGLVLSGLANIAGDDDRGLALSGLMNVSGGSSTGVQASSLLNVTGEDMTGFQLSALGNVAGGKLKGVQIGLANVATRAQGVQIGLFNYYKDKFDGLQLGLVNANPHTRVQLLLSGSNSTKINLAARFKNDRLYTIVGAGAPYFGFGDKFSGALFYRAGAELPLYRHLSLSGDLGYRHIETFRKNDADCPARLYSLQARINLEYRLTDAMGIFVSGGYGWDRYYNRNSTYDQGIIIEGGIVLFKY
ncbi:hypothetical protein [Mediterranea massiliensis]|uniref:LA_2272 family surface repeat-containing protein n=1 Tax=Mediterranea massiliensis TaxID=1841865 RepID=UPI0023F3D3F2|nr:hypothetical protein [Mediterranea massiliensis]